MPIYEYRCGKCGEVSEILVLGKEETPVCGSCGSDNVTKIMSAHNTASTARSFSPPTGGSCCGSPNSCGTPGSCCSN